MSSSSLINKTHFNRGLKLKTLLINLKNSIQFKKSKKYDKQSYEIATESNSYIKGFQISNSSFSVKSNKNLILQMKALAKEKIISQYNCTPTKFNYFIINNIIRNNYCHVVSIFKDILINYSNIEFINKAYNLKEAKRLINKFYLFYKNYFVFYCKPVFSCLSKCSIMKNYYNKKANCFLDLNNYTEKLNLEDDASNSIYSNKNKTIETLTDSQNFFNYKVRETLENTTIITNVSDASDIGTINLNMNNEKLEVFKENKKEYSNNTTFEEILKYLKNKKIFKESNIKINKLKKDLKNVLINYKNNKKTLELNNNCSNISHNKKIKNKKNIPVIKINSTKLKLNNSNIKKLKTNLMHENANKSSNHQIKSEYNIRNNDLINNNEYLNLKNILIKNPKNNFNKIKQLKINKSINNNINENKEKINVNNNNISSNIHFQKNIKKIDKTITNLNHKRENTIINQKVSMGNKNKLSRNKLSSLQTISAQQQNSKFLKNKKDRKLSSYKILLKNNSNNKKKYKKSKTKIISSNGKHIRHNTKIIRSQNIKKIFKSLYSNLKTIRPNNNAFNNIHINKSHNYNKSSLLNNLKIDYIMNTTSSRNNHIINQINTLKIKTSCYSSLYNERSYKSLKNKEILKNEIRMKSKKNFKKMFSLNIKKNSLNNIYNNKSISLLNKTYENNLGISIERSLKTLSKQNKNNEKLRTNKIRKSSNSYLFNNDSLKINKTQELNIKENKNIFKKINSFGNRRNYKTSILKQIFNNKIIFRNIEEKKIVKKDGKDFSKINFSYNLNKSKNKDIKSRLKNICKNNVKINNILKTYTIRK